MTVVEPATDPPARPVLDVHHSPRRKPLRGLFDHLLKHPGMSGPPLDLEADGSSVGGIVSCHTFIPSAIHQSSQHGYSENADWAENIGVIGFRVFFVAPPR